MKRIYITISLLFLAMITMAYFYFSKLNTDNRNNDTSLQAAIFNSPIIFCMQNDKSIFEILKGQDLFSHLIGEEKHKTLNPLQETFLSDPEINKLFYGQNIYLSLLPGKNKNLDFLLSTQFINKEDQPLLLNRLKDKNVKIENIHELIKLTLKDTTAFYAGIYNNLVLISNSGQKVLDALKNAKEKKQNLFGDYIKSDHMLKENSLANLFLNFNQFPGLINNITTGINGDLAVFKQQNTFSSLSYNFSKERLLFNGSTQINDANNYLNLFSGLKPQKITIDNILPQNTANYTIYAIEDYSSWKKTFHNWLAKQKDNNLKILTQNIQSKYRLNLEETFPRYVKDQFVTFQLRTSEKLGAINLIDGDKLAQQLLDISTSYSSDIRLFKEPDLLYLYFGDPFKKFKRPYYTIIDNYMVFTNNASSLQDFLNSYQKDKLLINTVSYSNAFNQISATSTVLFYMNNDQSIDILRNSLLPGYYKHYRDEKGLKQFETLVWQLSGDNKKFQTNVLLNRKVDEITTNSSANNPIN